MVSSMLDLENRPNAFYRNYYQLLIMILISAIFMMLFAVGLVYYQVFHRPVPEFNAQAVNGQHMTLMAFNEPNLRPANLLKWAGKAAVAAYSFDFVNYGKQIALARPYFTADGWTAYQQAVAGVIQRVTKDQLFANGVISGTPVISNQGPLPGHGYTWRVQLPFTVTYQSADKSQTESYIVVLMIVKVPTNENPDGIGIDRFLMI